jgi:hypothetical protein
LSVLIVSAILVLSAFMFTAQLMAESHITKTDAMFKSALSEAESGLSTVLAMVHTGVKPDIQDWAVHFGTNTAIPAITGTSVSNGVRGAYVVTSTLTLPVNNGTVGTVENWTGNLDLVATAAVYPPAVTSMLSGSLLANGYSARRSIKTRAQVSWTKTGTGTPGITSFKVDYGVFTGGDLSIKGAASEWHGNVYAGGNAYIQKNNSVVDGEVYASGQITGNPPGTPHPNVAKQPFPEMDIASLRSMAQAYIAGAWPYNGDNGGVAIPNSSPPTFYTNTSDSANRIKYKVDLHAANPTNTAYFLDPTAVYFVDGSMQLNGGNLQGTIVVNGDLRINGNITVGSGGTLPTIIATGNITKENGCSSINGIVYTGGSFTGNGTASITGALIARGTVNMKGTLDIYYNKALGTIVTGQTPPGTGSTTYALSNMTLPDSSGRIWQEVIPN